MEIYRKVKCSDRLPEVEDSYYVVFKNHNKGLSEFLEGEFMSFKTVEYWLELVETELESEKILPIENRMNRGDIINLYKAIDAPIEFQLYFTNIHKALGAAGLEIVKLKQQFGEGLTKDFLEMN